jgi:hypothetical protein
MEFFDEEVGLLRDRLRAYGVGQMPSVCRELACDRAKGVRLQKLHTKPKPTQGTLSSVLSLRKQNT